MLAAGVARRSRPQGAGGAGAAAGRRLRRCVWCGALDSGQCLPMEVTMRDTLIQSDPSIMMGKPVIAGTRITVELVLEKLGSGETIEQILQAHPRLTREGVLAAVRFGAAALRADVAYPVAELVS